MSAGVVIEVGEPAQSVRGARREPFRPLVENVVSITASVFSGTEVEADVDKRANNQLAGCGALHVVQAERDVVAPQQFEHAIVVPTRIPEFHNVLGAASGARSQTGTSRHGRERPQKFLEPFEVEGPTGRQLIEDGPEMTTELPDTVEETPERLLGILQLLHVSQKAVCL